jgi:hypothetical protein
MKGSTLRLFHSSSRGIFILFEIDAVCKSWIWFFGDYPNSERISVWRLNPCCFLARCVSQARAVARFLAAINAKFSHLTTCGSQTFGEDLILSESSAKHSRKVRKCTSSTAADTHFINLQKLSTPLWLK